jgi:histidinol dehydrogenase
VISREVEMASRVTSKLLRVLKPGDSGFEKGWQALCDRHGERSGSVERDVQKVLRRVRDGGDAELRALVRKHDRARLDKLEVGRDEWDDACERVDAADRAALGKAAMRVRDFHRKRIPSSWEMREEGGAFLGHKVRPLDSVGLYGATCDLRSPSAIIMNAIPASVVEVREIVMTAAPARDGRVDPALLTAARVAGVHRVFSTGPRAFPQSTRSSGTVPSRSPPRNERWRVGWPSIPRAGPGRSASSPTAARLRPGWRRI